jgi:single-strand DNA-binding protein
MFNKVILAGNLTRDVELRYSGNSLAIGNTAIATNRKYKTSTGEQKEDIMFMDITFFGRSAEVANQYLKKGSKVLVEGRLIFDQWVDQNGQKRNKHSLTVETMQMLGNKADATNEDNNSTGANNYSQPNNAPQNSNHNNNSSYANGNNSYQNQNNSYQSQDNNYQNQDNGGYKASYQDNQQAPVQNQYSNNSNTNNQYSNNQNSQQQTSPQQRSQGNNLPVIDIDDDEIPF